MKRRPKILLFLFLILLLSGGFFGFNSPVFAEDSCNNHVVISEIYGGGGNSGAKYTNDFIELYNPTGLPINLTNWTIQYATATGSFSKMTLLSETIESKSYYLIQESAGNNSVKDLPIPDATGSISISSTAGKIALVNDALLITNISDAHVIDFVGYGNDASQSEGNNPAKYPSSNSEGIFRKNAICLDSTNNELDFGKQAPDPQNSKYSEPVPIIYSDKIKLNEIFPNPIGSSEKDNEFVEIFNSGDIDIDLTDWYLSGKSGTFKLSGIIEAGKYKAFFDTITLYNEKSTVKLFNPIDEQADEITYPNPTADLENFSYSFDGTDWLWTSIPTAGKENKFDPIEDVSDDTEADSDSPDETIAPKYNVYLNEILPNPKGDEKSGEFIEIFNAENLEADISGWTLKDSSTTKYVFPAGTKIAAKQYLAIYRTIFKFTLNNSGPETVYLLNKAGDIASSVSYDGDAKEDISYSLDGTTWRWNNLLTPGQENKFEKKLKVSIVKIKANPKSKDADGEEIYLKNNSKKKINLKTWSIATGSKILANHPVTKDFVIKPGKTKKITRKYSLFTLNNKKGIIELRYPNGEVASHVKYDKKKETVRDDEVYELSGKKWQWNAPSEETSIEEIIPKENSEDIDQEVDLNISDEEISLNLGKYSAENKLALAEINFLPPMKNLLQSRETSGIVLGTFSVHEEIRKPTEIKSTSSWNKIFQKSNQFFNLLINLAVSLP